MSPRGFVASLLYDDKRRHGAPGFRCVSERGKDEREQYALAHTRMHVQDTFRLPVRAMTGVVRRAAGRNGADALTLLCVASVPL